MLPLSNLSLAVAIFDSISETERLRLEWLNVRILLLHINQALTGFHTPSSIRREYPSRYSVEIRHSIEKIPSAVAYKRI